MWTIFLTAFFVGVARWLGSYLPPLIITHFKKKRREKTTLHRIGKKGGSQLLKK